jgi:hypothetical protein
LSTYTDEPTWFGPLLSENRGGATSSYHINAIADQQHNSGNQQFSRNPSNNTTTTSWNFANQPPLYKLGTGARVTCPYNADNRQVQKKE